MRKVHSVLGNWPCAVVIAIYFLCILLANPRGEFPLNDDWSYTRSAFSLGSGHGLKVDEWCAPSLVGQALYGGLLSRLTSFSYLALHISILFLSCGTILLLWGILRRARFRKELAAIMLLAWPFNPLQFNLSFTLMTEVPFVFFIALSVCLYGSHIENGRSLPLVLCAAALGYGFMIRQTALLFILALIGSLLLAGSVAGSFVAGYSLWILARGSATAAVQRKFELLKHLTARQLIGNSYGMFFYLAFILMPVWIFLIPPLYRAVRDVRPVVRIGIPAILSVLVLTGIWWFHAQYRPAEYLPSAAYRARMPFLLNVLYDTGLGPVTLDSTYYAAPATQVYPRLWGAVIAGCICLAGLLGRPRDPPGLSQRPVLFLWGFRLFF